MDYSIEFQIYNHLLDRKIPSLVVFLDESKAFDTIGHTELLNELEKIGIRVKDTKTQSDPKTIESGVPQGTVLGPILLNI